MRVGIMCHASFGGSVRIATELAAELARRGHQVHLCTRTTPFGGWKAPDGLRLHRLIADDEDDGHPASLYVDWSAAELQTYVSRLLEVIATEGLDVLHFHYAYRLPL